MRKTWMASQHVHGLSTCAWPLNMCMASQHVHGLSTYAWPLYMYMASLHVHGLSTCACPLYMCMASLHVHALQIKSEVVKLFAPLHLHQKYSLTKLTINTLSVFIEAFFPTLKI